MAFTCPGTSSMLTWPAPTVWPMVITGHRRRRSADALAGTAEPIETIGTLQIDGRWRDRQVVSRGLINQAVPADQLMPAAHALAAGIIRSAPLAVAAVLEVLDATETGSVRDGFATLRSGRLPRYASMLASEDAAEGPAAFAARRPPIWKGR